MTLTAFQGQSGLKQLKLKVVFLGVRTYVRVRVRARTLDCVTFVFIDEVFGRCVCVTITVLGVRRILYYVCTIV